MNEAELRNAQFDILFSDKEGMPHVVQSDMGRFIQYQRDLEDGYMSGDRYPDGHWENVTFTEYQSGKTKPIILNVKE